MNNATLSPRQKAAELVDKMCSFIPTNDDVKIEFSRHHAAIECTLLLVDEVLISTKNSEYYQEVREELEQLK